MANDALKQMRLKEMRYLSSDITYPAANELIRSIDSAKPASVLLETALNTAEKNQTSTKSSKVKTTKVSTSKTKSKPKANPPSNKTKSTPTIAKNNTSSSNSNSSGNPFAGL